MLRHMLRVESLQTANSGIHFGDWMWLAYNSENGFLVWASGPHPLNALQFGAKVGVKKKEKMTKVTRKNVQTTLQLLCFESLGPEWRLGPSVRGADLAAACLDHLQVAFRLHDLPGMR